MIWIYLFKIIIDKLKDFYNKNKLIDICMNKLIYK